MHANKTIADAVRVATATLSDVSQTPRLDAELLAAFALQMPRGDMLVRARDLMTPGIFAHLIQRRAAHEPVAYIIGTQAFWDIELLVTPDVLIPRSDSETLIEAAQSAFAGTQGPCRILDLGTGSGALLLAALSLFPLATGVGIDTSVAALHVAQDNARALGFDDRVVLHNISWHDTSWTKSLNTGNAGYDLILCNPPYIETTAILDPMVADYEPHSALFAGADGLDDYRVLLPYMPNLLSHGGAAIFEIGYTQQAAVIECAHNAGLDSKLHRDLTGNPRCLTLRVR
jgi:release factor glutamine methyltransferase